MSFTKSFQRWLLLMILIIISYRLAQINETLKAIGPAAQVEKGGAK
jgi:hypothetical protein